MYPVVSTHSAGIDEMRQIVFCVCDHEIGVGNRIVAVHWSDLAGLANPCSRLRGLKRSFGSGEADETFVEIVKPSS